MGAFLASGRPLFFPCLRLARFLQYNIYVLDVLRRAYNRQVYNPPIIEPGGPKTGGMQGGDGARNGQAQARKLLQTLRKWRAYPVNIARVVGIVRLICNADTSLQAAREPHHSGL